MERHNSHSTIGPSVAIPSSVNEAPNSELTPEALGKLLWNWPAMVAVFWLLTNDTIFTRFLKHWFPQPSLGSFLATLGLWWVGTPALTVAFFAILWIAAVLVIGMRDSARSVRTWWARKSFQRLRLARITDCLPFSTQQTIVETRADNDYEYDRAVQENRLHYARWIRFSGRFIILKAVAYDLVVTLFEHITDNVKNIFRLG